ncbi:MAG: acyl-ACP--UDP-N-acetylglucosamine O-acyltransferase [Muribaculaceae bacterium]|nr:acyl-ACP--UDP-N-acetylglucosamine O-acyltransferase [Muribaculaceae bacterium]
MIHPSAYVHPDARIGENVEIGPFTVIHGNVEIGDGCRIENNVTVFDGARIGRNVHIFPGAVVSAIPQDLKFKGEETTAVIGDGTTLRECVTINRGTAAKGRTVVGNNCLIMAYSHVAHDCVVGDSVIISNASQLAGEVVVEDCAVIGGGSLIHQFCHIGSYVMLQGGALVNKDIPPYVKAAREPISYVGVNAIGLRRHGFTSEQIDLVSGIYRTLYTSGMIMSDALAQIEAEFEDSEIRQRIVNFIRSSERGIVRGY